jgi:hypothetical protein
VEIIAWRDVALARPHLVHLLICGHVGKQKKGGRETLINLPRGKLSRAGLAVNDSKCGCYVHRSGPLGHIR